MTGRGLFTFLRIAARTGFNIKVERICDEG